MLRDRLFLPVNFCGIELFRFATLLASLSSSRARSVPIWDLDVWLSSAWQQENKSKKANEIQSDCRVQCNQAVSSVKSVHAAATAHLSTLLMLWSEVKHKSLLKHQLLQAKYHKEEQDINLIKSSFDLTSWCYSTSPVLEKRPQGEDVLPHHWDTIRHKLTTLVTTDAQHCMCVAIL